jgi:hypothetical protein
VHPIWGLRGGGLTGVAPPRWRSRGGGARQRPAGREPAGVDLQVGEWKGASAVLSDVKVAPEVDRSG